MASKAYVFKTCTDGVGAYTGITNVQENDTVEAITKHRADTSVTNEAIWLDGVGAQIVVTTTDVSAANARALGATGQLVILKQQRANGTGAVGAADLTATYAEVVLVAKSTGTPSDGEATVDLTYEAYDTDGTAVVVHS